MRLTKTLATLASTLLFAACGEGLTLSGGNYDITFTGFGALNTCSFTENNNPVPSPVNLVVDGDTVTAEDWGGHPTGTLADDVATLAANFQYDNTPDGFDCQEQITKDIVLTLDADDSFAGTITYKSSYVSGAACANLGYPLPCQTDATFTGLKAADAQ